MNGGADASYLNDVQQRLPFGRSLDAGTPLFATGTPLLVPYVFQYSIITCNAKLPLLPKFYN
jgi:hypothetical protein